MFRRAGPADMPAMEAFLRRHDYAAMFPLTNLLREGLARPGAPDNPLRSLHAWIAGEGIEALFAITDEGMLLPVLPGDTAGRLDGLRDLLAGYTAMGIAGEAGAARASLATLGLDLSGARRAADEPHYLLGLADLLVPDCPDMQLVPATEAHRNLLMRWRIHYHTDTLGTPPGEAATQALRDVDTWLARDTARILLRGGVPVSMAGLNATAGDIVQVGGVYTPPDLRRQGLARRAVALMLRERHERGASRATLFAASADAARAYEAIGFRRIGDYALIIFDGPQRIPA